MAYLEVNCNNFPGVYYNDLHIIYKNLFGGNLQ